MLPGPHSVKFNHSVMSDSFWLHGLQHIRTPCPSPTPRAYSNSCPSSRRCRPTIESAMPSNHLILCRPLFLLPSIFPSIRVFSNESVLCIRWPKHWSFSFSISPSNEYSGLISFRTDWFDLLAVLLLLLLSHFSRVWLCVIPQMAAHQAPPSLGLSRQEHWSGLPFPSPICESEKWKWSRSVVSDS